MFSKLKQRLYAILNIHNPQDSITRIVNVFLIILILINVAAFLLQTFEEFSARYALLFAYLENFSVAVFTVEYILRLWVCNLNPMYREPVIGRLRYAFSNLSAITDLIAILPYYLPIVLPFDLLAIRAFSLFRLARVAMLARYSDSLELIERVIVKQREFLLVTLAIQVVLLLVSSTIMYYLEHEAQPEKFANILSAFLWGIGAMTSGFVGLAPITPAGRIAGVVLSFLEVVAMALPIGVVTAGIEQEMNIIRETEERKAASATRKEYLLKAVARKPR